MKHAERTCLEVRITERTCLRDGNRRENASGERKAPSGHHSGEFMCPTLKMPRIRLGERFWGKKTFLVYIDALFIFSNSLILVQLQFYSYELLKPIATVACILEVYYFRPGA